MWDEELTPVSLRLGLTEANGTVGKDKRSGEDPGEEKMSKRKRKRMERNPYKPFSKARANCALCTVCGNPSGLKCLNHLCGKCCRDKAYKVSCNDRDYRDIDVLHNFKKSKREDTFKKHRNHWRQIKLGT